MIVAVVAVLAGVLCLRHPLQTTAVLSLVLGAYWLVSGLLVGFIAIVGRDMPHRGMAFAVAALGVVAGIVVLAFPVQSAVALARLVGLWLVLLGLAEAAAALALRSLAKRPAAAWVRPGDQGAASPAVCAGAGSAASARPRWSCPARGSGCPTGRRNGRR